MRCPKAVALRRLLGIVYISGVAMYTITGECLEMSELQEEIGQVSKRFKNVAGEDFSFGYVYSIVDVDISNAVAVNINNEYRKADIKNNDE